ncbi:hypothetical protein BDF21DRAFT_497204 [Thamnidium elegans]|nr:hypothetical protein BDF21DRAFT_497204 [Thamnidium elegans]
MSNTGFTPTNQSNNLFPPLDSSSDNQPLLWNNVNTFTMRDDSECSSSPPNAGYAVYPLVDNNNNNNTKAEDPTVFNISWGGDDKPPCELHPEKEIEEPVKLSRPLPKPRGIRKLPEPEPSEDGTIDEDTLKRRKNTDAARRSRMKKFMKVDQLENRVASLQAENAKLTLNNAVLESEKRSLYAKENEYKKRIRYLEEVMKCNGWDFSTDHTQW